MQTVVVMMITMLRWWRAKLRRNWTDGDDADPTVITCGSTPGSLYHAMNCERLMRPLPMDITGSSRFAGGLKPMTWQPKEEGRYLVILSAGWLSIKRLSGGCGSCHGWTYAQTGQYRSTMLLKAIIILILDSLAPSAAPSMTASPTEWVWRVIDEDNATISFAYSNLGISFSASGYGGGAFVVCWCMGLSCQRLFYRELYL